MKYYAPLVLEGRKGAYFYKSYIEILLTLPRTISRP